MDVYFFLGRREKEGVGRTISFAEGFVALQGVFFFLFEDGLVDFVAEVFGVGNEVGFDGEFSFLLLDGAGVVLVGGFGFFSGVHKGVADVDDAGDAFSNFGGFVVSFLAARQGFGDLDVLVLFGGGRGGTLGVFAGKTDDVIDADRNKVVVQRPSLPLAEEDAVLVLFPADARFHAGLQRRDVEFSDQHVGKIKVADVATFGKASLKVLLGERGGDPLYVFVHRGVHVVDHCGSFALDGGGKGLWIRFRGGDGFDLGGWIQGRRAWKSGGTPSFSGRLRGLGWRGAFFGGSGGGGALGRGR